MLSEGYGSYRPGELKDNNCAPHRPRVQVRSGYKQSETWLSSKKLVSWTFSAHNTGRLFPEILGTWLLNQLCICTCKRSKGYFGIKPTDKSRWKCVRAKEILKIPQNTVYSRPVIYSNGKRCHNDPKIQTSDTSPSIKSLEQRVTALFSIGL